MSVFENTAKESNIKTANINKFMDGSGTIQEDLKSIKEGGLGLVRHAKEDATEMAERMVNEGGHKFEELKTNSSKYIKMIEKEVSEKPIRSMAIALGIGAFLSLFLKRG